jgi:pentatricopeptide repeat protein
MKFQTSTWLQFLMAIGLYSKDTACDAFSSSSRMHKLLDVQVAHPFTITKIRHDHQSTASRSRLHSTSSASYPTPTIKTSGTPYENTQEQEQELIANIQSYKNSNSISEKPTPAAFTSLIEQWLTFPQPERAQFVLDRMEELYTPSGRIYERIINAWSFAAAECIDRVNLLDDDEGDTSNDNGNDNDNDNVNDQRSEEDEEELLKKKKKLREESVYCSAKAFDLLSRMELLHQEISGGDFRPALSTYTSVINSIMRSCKTDPGAAAGASINSDGMEDNERSAKEGVDLASQRETVERIRSRRDEIYQQRNDIDHHLKIRIHNIQDVFDILDLFQEDGVVVAAAAFERNSSGRVAKVSAGQHKQQVSMELEETPHELFAKMKRGPQGSLVASRFNFNLIINALAQTGETWAAQAAENILDYMVNQCSAIGGEVDVKISDDQTNGIKSKSNSKRNRSTTRSKDKVKLNVLQTHPQLTPSIETINGCINAWAHCTSTEPTAPTRAEAILEKLNDLQQQGKLTTVTPDNVSYNTIIKAYANKADAERAEAILGTMVELYESTGDDKIKPDIISYSSVLNAYAKAAQRDPYASKKSEDILMQMVKMQERENTRTRGNVKGRTRIVNTWCFNTVLNAYAVQGAGSRASALLHQMEVMGETDELVKPDTYSFNTVLKALANSNEKGSIERARLILDKMEKCFANGDTRVKPDAITYNTVVSAYANNGGMTVGRAGKSIVTNNGGKRVGRAAKSIVKRMEDRYLDGDLEVKPTSPTYTSLIKGEY